MTQNTKVVTIFAFLCQLLTGAYGSTIVGNGVEVFNPLKNAPWFSGRQEISVCIQASEYFESHFDLSAKVFRAFDTWGAYLDERVAQTARSLFPKGILLVRCDGPVDLKIYFGDGPEDQTFKGFYAFSQRYGRTRAHGERGYIWISPPRKVENPTGKRSLLIPFLDLDWASYSKTLDLFLLHEFGHVLGLGHQQGTIMDSHLGYYAFAPILEERSRYSMEAWAEELFAIDHACELIAVTKSETRYSGTVPSETLANLFGKDGQGASSGAKAEVRLSMERAILVISHEGESLELELKLDKMTAVDQMPAMPFAGQSDTNAYSQFGSARIQGREVGVLLERNFFGNHSPLKITAIRDGRFIELFKAESTGWHRFFER